MPTPVAVTVNTITRAGVALASELAGDATNGHTVANDGRVFIIAHNSNGASTARTVTIAITKQVDGEAVASKTYSIAAAASKLIGPFPVATYGSSLGITVSHAEMKLAAYHL